MAKRKGVLDKLLNVLGDAGGDVLTDAGRELFGAEVAGKEGAGGLLANGGELLQGIGDAVQDLTGLGGSNARASATAQKTGKQKSSSAQKTSPVRRASSKPRTSSRAASSKVAKFSSSKKKIAP